MNLSPHLFTFLKGLTMGAADIIPGVSGGTIAFITGIYTRLIDAISHVADFFKPATWKEVGFWEWLREVDYALFIPLVAGIGTSFLLLSNVMHYLLVEQTALTYSFFFGLIAASAVYLFRQLESKGWGFLAWALLGTIIGAVAVNVSGVAASTSLLYLFFSGAVAICAMILPGISGAMILVILNQYEYVIGLIKNLDFGKMSIFGLGAITGLLLFSELLHYLLHNHKNKTISFLTGLMVGSLWLPMEVIAAAGDASSILLGLTAAFGAALVLMLERFS